MWLRVGVGRLSDETICNTFHNCTAIYHLTLSTCVSVYGVNVGSVLLCFVMCHNRPANNSIINKAKAPWSTPTFVSCARFVLLVVRVWCFSEPAYLIITLCLACQTLTTLTHTKAPYSTIAIWFVLNTQLKSRCLSGFNESIELTRRGLGLMVLDQLDCLGKSHICKSLSTQRSHTHNTTHRLWVNGREARKTTDWKDEKDRGNSRRFSHTCRNVWRIKSFVNYVRK